MCFRDYDGKVFNLKDFLKAQGTTGLVIIKDSKITFEDYWLGNDETTKTISWSVAKSMISALIGTALEEGLIRDIYDPVTDYVPFLKGTGYDGVPIKHVLQMSSGIGFDENYADFNSDINRLGRLLALNASIDDFVASLKNIREPGTYNQYVSMDTQVLSMVIEIYPITIDSEADLAREVARIANLSLNLGYKLEKEGRMLSRQEAYQQQAWSGPALLI